MKSGICPKCGSDEVYKRESAYHVVIWLSWKSRSLPYYYVCADCGHVEWYIEEQDDLETIRKKWKHATGKHKRKRGG